MLWWKLRKLKSLNAERAQRAAEELMESGALGIEGIKAAIKNGDDKTRAMILKVLISIDEKRVNELLEDLLKDNSTNSIIIEVFTDSGDPRGIAHLSQEALWEDDEYSRRFAAKTLRKYKSPDNIQILINNLQYSRKRYDFIRGRAAEALGIIGDASAVSHLIMTLSDELEGNRSAAEKALYVLGWRPESTLVQIGEERAVKSLISVLLSRYSDMQEEAAAALVQIGDAAVEHLIVALNNADSDMQKRAASVLVKIGDAAVEPLVAAIRDSHWKTRRAATEVLQALGWQPTDESHQALFAIELGNWDEAVRLGAAAVEALVAALENKEYKVREEAIRALGKIRDARAVPSLVKLTSDVSLSEISVSALHQIFKHSVRHIEVDDLRAVATMNDVAYMVIADCASDSYLSMVDCLQVRQLARQELVRRGLEA